MKRLMSLTALIGAMMLASTRNAYAYLDPGLGSMLLQGLIAGIAAASVVVGHYWSRLKSFVRAFRRVNPAEEDASDSSARK